MSDTAPSEPAPSLHQFAYTLLRWTEAQPLAKDVPPKLLEALRALPPAEQAQSLKDLCGLAAAAAHHGETGRAYYGLIGVRTLLKVLPEHQAATEDPWQLARLMFARSVGDLDTVLELWPKYMQAAAAEVGSILFAFFCEVRDVRDRLKSRISEEQAQAIATLLMPIPPQTVQAVLEREPWISSAECRDVLQGLLAEASSGLQQTVKGLVTLLDEASERSPEAQHRREAGRQRAAELTRLAASTYATGEAEGILAAADRLDVPPVHRDEARGLLASLYEAERLTVPELIPAWLAWRGVQKAAWPEHLLARFAREVMELMRHCGGEYAVAKRRRYLGEYALQHAKDENADWYAPLFYSLLHTYVRLTEYEGDTLELVQRQVFAGQEAHRLFYRIGNIEGSAQSLELMLLGRTRLPEDKGGGITKTIEYIDSLLAESQAAEEDRQLDIPSLHRATLLACRYRFLRVEGSLSDALYARSHRDLEEAYQIVSSAKGQFERDTLVRVCFLLSSLELRRAQQGHEEALAEGRRWSERGLELADSKTDPEGLAIASMTYVQILRKQGDRHAALAWVTKALSIPGQPSGFRVSLLLDRARLRLDDERAPREELLAGLHDAEEVQRLLGPSPNEELRWQLIRVTFELHRAIGDHAAAADVVLRGLRAWEKILTPAHRAALRAQLIPELQRRQLDSTLDEDEAERQLDALLGEVSQLPPDALGAVREVAWQWLYYQCLRKDNLRFSETRRAALNALSKPGEGGLPIELLVEVWQDRATGAQNLPALFLRIEQAVGKYPDLEEPLLGLGFYLALRECEEESPDLERWARRLEAHLLDPAKSEPSTGAVDFLITLANVRLSAGTTPSIANTKAAEALVKKAEEVYPEERLSANLRARFNKVRHWMKLRLLGLTPGQDPHKMSLDAQLLARDAETLDADDRIKFLEELHHWLVRYAVPDARPLREYADVLRNQYGVGENFTERAEEIAELTNVSKKDQAELQSLREQGVPKDLAKDLLRGEHLAHLTLAEPHAADEGVSLLTALLSKAAAAVDAPWRVAYTARVHRALGQLWMYHKSQDRRTVLQNAIMHFERASSLWPTGDVDGYLEVAHDHANALWTWDSLDAKERQEFADRARTVIKTALAHPGAAAYPVRQALLYRLLGLVEQYEKRFNVQTDLARFRRMLSYHEKALELCPQGESDERFQILVTLANACRDYFGGQASKDREPAILERAIETYREALRVASQLRSLLPTEPARAKKCLAGALRLRGAAGDLDEAKALILESLEVRTERHFPISRAESLYSLAEVELDRYEGGQSDALIAARTAAVECQVLLARGGNPAIEASVAALLRRIQDLVGSQPQDAVGSGQAGPSIMDRMLEDAEKEHPELVRDADPRIHTKATSEDNIGRSALRDAMIQHVGLGFDVVRELTGSTDRGTARRVPLSDLLTRVEALLTQGDQKSANRILAAAFGASCGNPEDFQPEERRRLQGLTYQLLTDEFLDSLPWQEATLLRHQAVHALQGRWSHLMPSDWQWIEQQQRAAVTALVSQNAEDSYLPEVWKNLGLILWKRPYGSFQDRYREAQSLFKNALALARKHKQRTMSVSLLNDLATLFDELALEDPLLRYQAIDYYSQIIALGGTHGKDLDHHQLALGNRGWARINLPTEDQPQGYRDAITDLEAALKLCGDNPHLLRNRAHHYNHLGLAHMDMVPFESGHLSKSIDCFETSIEICQQLKDHVEEARAKQNLGLCLMRHGTAADLVRAKEVLKEALRVRRGRTIEEWETLGNLVGVRLRMRIPMGAFPDDPGLMADVKTLAERLEREQQYERALQTHGYIFELLLLRTAPDIRELIAVTDTMLSSAETIWGAATRTAAQQMYSQRIASLAAQRALLAAEAGEPPVNVLRHSQRGKARTLRWHRSLLLAELPPAVRSAYASQLAELARLRLSKQADDRAAALQKEEEITALLRRQGLASVGINVETTKLKQKLENHRQTALIDIALTPFGSVCTRAYLNRSGELTIDSKRLSLTSQMVQSWLHGDAKNKPRGWLSAIAMVGNALHEKGRSDAQLLDILESGHASCMRLLATLHEELIAPATGDLRGLGIDDLVMCLPGALGGLPLASACKIGSDGTPCHLIETFRSVALTPSIATWTESEEPISRIRRAATVMTELAMPQAAAPTRTLIERLRAAGTTIEELRENGTGRQRASVSNALAVLGEADLVHFVVHGRFEPKDSARSGLALSNGEILSVEQLLSLPVPSPSTMVVLAACSSGRTGTSDHAGEWLGISGAMLRIGVRNVIATLWDVETKATLRLIDAFYDALLGGQTNQAICLGMAMREQLKSGRAGELGGPHPLVESAPEQTLPRLRRLCASPLFWSGIVAMQAG